MSIIFLVVFFTVVVFHIKKKGRKNYDSSSFTYGRTCRDTGVYGQNMAMNGTNTGTNQANAGRTAAGGSPKAPKKEEKEPSKPSTLDYLNEKARQDQREHAMEKMEERKRASVKYGNRSVGGRYLLGDPIPQGMKIVCCEYCGAENVVKIAYRGDRDCYFCRTRLEA